MHKHMCYSSKKRKTGSRVQMKIFRRFVLVGALAAVSFLGMFTALNQRSVRRHLRYNAYFEPDKHKIEPRFGTWNESMTEKTSFKWNGHWEKSGNPLIDDYGKNSPMMNGENGRGLTFVGSEKKMADKYTGKYQINVLASDLIPLNRRVPDSRFACCANITYDENLPNASIIIPFYDEWRSILLRTVYSVINRTPSRLLHEVILVDDGSTAENLKASLDDYIARKFPTGLIKMKRLPRRAGLINARMEGWKMSTGQVLVFFDSHMEVNIDWLQPLLREIKVDRKTVAMGVLDYIQRETLEYRFNAGFYVRYGFDWRLVFFESIFPDYRLKDNQCNVKPGVTMVGAAYAIDREYFEEIGTYDQGMQIWGGENLEMSWRVWLCGGRLVHVPCSHFGHIARGQPYIFPGGRKKIEIYNYKRAVDVWMGPYKRFVYEHYPEMKTLDVGNLTERFALKEKLQCKNFSWYLENVWPELFPYDENVLAWGSAENPSTHACLDNLLFLFSHAQNLSVRGCHHSLPSQGFSLTKQGLLRTTLQCVVLTEDREGTIPKLQSCVSGPRDKWTHTKNGQIVHSRTKLCLDIDQSNPVMKACSNKSTQVWRFKHYVRDLNNTEVFLQ